MGLSKEEVEAEIIAVNECIKAHEAQLKLNTQGIKINGYIKHLLEREKEKFK